MALLIFIGFLYPSPAWKVFLSGQKGSPKDFLSVVVVYAFFFSAKNSCVLAESNWLKLIKIDWDCLKLTQTDWKWQKIGRNGLRVDENLGEYHWNCRKLASEISRGRWGEITPNIGPRISLPWCPQIPVSFPLRIFRIVCWFSIWIWLRKKILSKEDWFSIVREWKSSKLQREPSVVWPGSRHNFRSRPSSTQNFLLRNSGVGVKSWSSHLTPLSDRLFQLTGG